MSNILKVTIKTCPTHARSRYLRPDTFRLCLHHVCNFLTYPVCFSIKKLVLWCRRESSRLRPSSDFR
ncbi:unnamed protein product [Tenebrio molitor]|nr:unnamed protein product [Tenebrio molitor]